MSVFATPSTRAGCAVLALAVALGPAGPAAAQSLLKSLAREAALRTAAAALSGGASGASQADPAQTEADRADPDQAAAPVSDSGAPATEPTGASGPAPWPQNPTAKHPARLTFSPDLEAEKARFLEFSKVSCRDCEGGYSYDAWAQRFIRLDGSWKAWEKKLGALSMGESVTWQGTRAKGKITVVGEQAINGWPCKQLRWTLTRTDGEAQRPGLICNAQPQGSGDWTIAF